MIEIQHASRLAGVPGDAVLVRAAEAALARAKAAGDVTVRLVDRDEIQALNARFRDKDRPTNVLSFAQDVVGERGVRLLGDVIVCAGVVNDEAREQGKSPVAHYSHMVVHGTLHLLGYDHVQDDDAQAMEQLERDVLATLGFDDPYAPVTGVHHTAHRDRTALDV
jgi:probable rRNA maturation factor